jgi:hypothetical protein
MIQFKNKNARGQQEGTHSWTLIKHVHSCAYNWTEKYCTAREAKYQLLGGGPWEDSLRVLLDSDIRSYSDAPQKCQQEPQHGMCEDNELEGIEEDVVGVSGEGRIDLLPEVREKRNGTRET